MAFRMVTGRRGYDEQEIDDLVNDPETTGADILGAIIESCSPEQAAEIAAAAREMAEDRRGPHAWARDKHELRRLSKDARLRSRPRGFGRDDPMPFEGMPETGGGMYRGEERPIERFLPEREYRQEEGEDHNRRHARDIAFDASPAGRFERLFGRYAALIEEM
jgi:hypothetical protein